jgi:putative ABC transport system permease protein
VLLATLVASVVVATAFGLLPSFHARGWRVQSALRRASGRGASSAREHTRLRSALIVSELAMAAMLMVGAGLLIQSLWRLQQVDLGFNTAGVLKAEYQLPATRYPRDFAQYPRWAEVQRFNGELASRLGTMPRVSGVTLAAYHPLNAGSISSISVVGRETEAADWPEPAIRMVGDNYFDVMGVAVHAGRAFTPGDDASAPPVVVINEAARARFFPDRDPLGAQVNLWGASRTIVGVVANERFRGASEDVAPAVYPPIAQTPPAGGAYSVLVRGPGDVNVYAQSIRSVIRGLDPLLPVFGVEPLTVTFGDSVAQQRFTMLVLGLFALVALSLAAVGVHGVLSYSVSQRVPEIGIRMALGANPASVRSFVVGQGARLIALGLALGLGGALALSQLLGTLLYGVGPRDPLTFAAVATALAIAALVACYLPARRAARVDPLVALRSE